MASNREIEDIDGTFDVDVVGLTDLVEFKSDGDLFYFESNEEFGLFGEDGNSFSHSTSYTNHGERESSTNSSLSPGSDRGLRSSPPKLKKTKTWNEMEKDLFLKGLELFGKNWRKISKFMATKTSSQVKQYYLQWSETANVIPDAVNLANDTSIYLPFTSDNGSHLTGGFKESSDVLKDQNKSWNENNLKNSPSYTSGCQNLGTVEIPMGEGMVVSSLNDWNLGSQVSVNGTEEEEPFNSRGKASPGKRKKSSNNIQLKKCQDKLGKIKKLPLMKCKKVNKQSSNQVIKFNNTHNIIAKSKPHAIQEGQIIRLNKIEEEDSDVNIDDSDGEKDDTESRLVVCDKYKIKYKKRNEDADEKSRTPKVGGKLEYLKGDEQKFCISLTTRNNISISEYMSIRDCIVQHWERMKPVYIIREHINLPDYESRLIDSIFRFLKEHKLINSSSSFSVPNKLIRKQSSLKKVLPKRVKLNCVKDILSNEKLRTNVMKQGGGVTLSHDSSGAVIDTLHIPESSNSKKVSNSHNFQLRNYLKYNSVVNAPYKLLIYPQALIPLDLHSHSSLSEVIGLLGGFLDESEKVLHITLAIPTKSSSSKVDCEMCPLSQTEALQSIQNSGMKVIGWYHSHPTFYPNPSERDLGTQEQLQKWFKKNNVPFIGLIISSYSPICSSQASQIRCFKLESNPTQSLSSIKNKAPYQLEWKIHNEFDMEWDHIESSIKNVISKRNKNSCLKWKDNFIDGVSNLDKYINSLSLILPSCNEEVINLVKDFLYEII